MFATRHERADAFAVIRLSQCAVYDVHVSSLSPRDQLAVTDGDRLFPLQLQSHSRLIADAFSSASTFPRPILSITRLIPINTNSKYPQCSLCVPRCPQRRVPRLVLRIWIILRAHSLKLKSGLFFFFFAVRQVAMPPTDSISELAFSKTRDLLAASSWDNEVNLLGILPSWETSVPPYTYLFLALNTIHLGSSLGCQ